MILDDIVDKTKQRIEQRKLTYPVLKIKEEAYKSKIISNFPFEKALRGSDISFILEVKKASPSKGEIVNDFNYLEIAKEYEAIGASAISVLTEPYFFKGNDQYLKEIVEVVNIPTLRKDFVVDEYMIYEAKLLGASAILLICSILDEKTLKEYLTIAHQLGMSCLVETHDAIDLEKALRAGARIIGVNNRDLKTFSVDIENSIRLRKLVPTDIIFVSESGIQTSKDIKQLQDHKVNAVLIGETLMKSSNKAKMLEELRNKQ